MTPRYLVAFHPKRVLHRFTDLLVIGAGLSGLRAANAAHANQSVLVVTKDRIQESNSNYAQGGIAGVMDESDTFENHVIDTIRAGGSLCDPSVVDHVIRQAPRRIEELVEWGTKFDKEAGELLLGREGGHSHQRIVHALGDATGQEIMRAVIERTRQVPNISIMENTFTQDLLTHEGRCHGAVLDTGDGRPTLVWAKQTILCTGGAGQVFRESTNPPVATADGFAAAFRAGVELRDMEMIQFHPTVLYIAGSSRSLITEAIRGEGAYLVDASGNRFMPEYDERAELAPRDVVSQSIVRQMSKTQHPCVYLDLNHLDAKRVRSRFPGIAKACLKFGLDITQDRIPVRPGAHYMVGGVSVDIEGRTSLPGLWGAGEVTSSGLHGGNRLASNSLLEGLVYGAHAGEGAARAAAEMPESYQALKIEGPEIKGKFEPLDIDDIRNALKSMMGRLCGVQRDAKSLRDAAESINSFCGYALPQQFDSPEGWELQNLLLTARLMVTSALAREESRGVHFRTDFPNTNDEEWCRHITVQIDRDGGRPRLDKLRPATHVEPHSK